MYQPVVDPDVYTLTPYDMIPVVQISSTSFSSGTVVTKYNDEDLWILNFFVLQGDSATPK